MLDCGNGVFSKLRRFRDYTKVDAVVISHLHADHFLDLVPFSYALTYAPRQQPPRWTAGRAPTAPRGRSCMRRAARPRCFRRVVGAWGNEDLIENAFDAQEFGPDDDIEIGSMRFTFQDVPHFTETFAINIASTNGGGRITYGADCSPNEQLVEFARDTDLLIVEATLPRPERTGIRGHLTPTEAAEHASRANVKRVLLTHVSDELDELWVRNCACARLRRAGIGGARGRRLRDGQPARGPRAGACRRAGPGGSGPARAQPVGT